MSFAEELCNLSVAVEAEKNSTLLQEGKVVWDSIKKALKDFAKETGERGCNVFFLDISDQIIAQLEPLAKADKLVFMNWNSPSDAGHPGKPFEQIGVITWDPSWYFSKYPFKVSGYFLMVSNDDGITVKMVKAKSH